MCVHIEKILTYGNEKLSSYHDCLCDATLLAMSWELWFVEFHSIACGVVLYDLDKEEVFVWGLRKYYRVGGNQRIRRCTHLQLLEDMRNITWVNRWMNLVWAPAISRAAQFQVVSWVEQMTLDDCADSPTRATYIEICARMAENMQVGPRKKHWATRAAPLY